MACCATLLTENNTTAILGFFKNQFNLVYVKPNEIKLCLPSNAVFVYLYTSPLFHTCAIVSYKESSHKYINV